MKVIGQPVKSHRERTDTECLLMVADNFIGVTPILLSIF